jgi:hypothetical protein
VNSITSVSAGTAAKSIFDDLGQAEDISKRVNRMPRDVAILYPKTKSERIEYQG